MTCPACHNSQVRHVASEPDETHLLRDCILMDADTNLPIALVASVSQQAAGWVAAAARSNIKGTPGYRARLSGMGDRSTVFGTLAPQALRKRYGCQRSAVSRSTPPERWQTLATECAERFHDHLPLEARVTRDAANDIGKDWKWAGTGWTSGVLNLTQLLPYHKDSGNLPGAWSAMVGARSLVTGGHLHLPEYDVTLAVDHRSLICFPGGEVVHGVTPIHVRTGGWRVTCVFYGLNAVRRCAPCAEQELARSRTDATRRARAVGRGETP